MGNFQLISTDTNKGQSVVNKRKSEEHPRPVSFTITSLHTEKIIFSPLSLALLKNCEGFEKYFYRTNVQRTTDTELTDNTAHKQDWFCSWLRKVICGK